MPERMPEQNPAEDLSTWEGEGGYPYEGKPKSAETTPTPLQGLPSLSPEAVQPLRPEDDGGSVLN